MSNEERAVQDEPVLYQHMVGLANHMERIREMLPWVSVRLISRPEGVVVHVSRLGVRPKGEPLEAVVTWGEIGQAELNPVIHRIRELALEAALSHPRVTCVPRGAMPA